ncbi:class I SAM-dependent methyltransferase [Aquabacter spiritensis]|uniref:Methyltransferase family protein n=1 Tax=Aquabacter spiritensis TaxID=933073 RepID=A0A4R3LTX0_9HYPH|nr:class I SAM-dependent methyltransferase [Aquabacter spiritensis]TCT04002.1 methyltransferase family protein [Aquabacter spiritensis]
MHYLKFLKALHDRFDPEVYFEIGVRRGASMTLARRTAIGVDPSYLIENPLCEDAHLFQEKSDDFFATKKLSDVLGSRKIDLAFIDGWHNFEFALRDFINTESYCNRRSIVVFDDVRPRSESEAVRQPHGGAWTGDVWRIVDCLTKYRPDLKLTLAATNPTGLLIVEELDPASKGLSSRYKEIEVEYLDPTLPLMPGPELLSRFITPEAALLSIGQAR